MRIFAVLLLLSCCWVTTYSRNSCHTKKFDNLIVRDRLKVLGSALFRNNVTICGALKVGSLRLAPAALTLCGTAAQPANIGGVVNIGCGTCPGDAITICNPTVDGNLIVTNNVTIGDCDLGTGDVVIGNNLDVCGSITEGGFPVVTSADTTPCSDALVRYDDLSTTIITSAPLRAPDVSGIQPTAALLADDCLTPDLNLALIPKGTGALTAAIPDNTAIGGEARGRMAVDWQMTRSLSSQVASGFLAATIAGGNANTASGGFSTVGGGTTNTAGINGASTVEGGNSNTSSGTSSVVGGGISNLSSSSNTLVMGGATNQASTTNAAIFGGSSNTASGDASFVGGGTLNTASATNSTVGAGSRNTSSEQFSTIAGGTTNINTGGSTNATISGGSDNRNTAAGVNNSIGGGAHNFTVTDESTVVGGETNSALTGRSTVIGGGGNSANGVSAFVGGGLVNRAISDRAIVMGGNSNTAAATQFGTIGGGTTNNISTGIQNIIAGGSNNSITLISNASLIGGILNQEQGLLAAVGGGSNNRVLLFTTNSVVSGGDTNIASGSRATVSGGTLNTAAGANSVIRGGTTNSITSLGNAATVSGGSINTASSQNSTVGGGANNTASTVISPTVRGGLSNLASGDGATVIGGSNNSATNIRATIGGGSANLASGNTSTIPGGNSNLASATQTFAAGRQARAVNAGAFVWADSSGVTFSSTASNQFNIRAAGGTRIFSDATLTSGVLLNSGANAWVGVSDRNLKENFAKLDTIEILNKLVAMPVQSWNYKAQPPSIRHIGPMAQDFNPAFNFTEAPLGISTLDADGVALAAIQGLYKLHKQKINILETTIQQHDRVIYKYVIHVKNGSARINLPDNSECSDKVFCAWVNSVNTLGNSAIAVCLNNRVIIRATHDGLYKVLVIGTNMYPLAPLDNNCLRNSLGANG